MQNIAPKTPQPTPQNASRFCENRLNAAFFYTNELRDSRLREIKNRRSKRWDVEARAQKSHKIKQVKPWQRSTGPKTVQGKGISALNAYKHGRRALVRQRFVLTLRLQNMLCRRALLLQKIGYNLRNLEELTPLLEKLLRHEAAFKQMLHRHNALKNACADKNYEIDMSIFSHHMLESFEKVMIHV